MGARYLITQLRETELPQSYLSRLAEDSYERWPPFVEALECADCDVDATVAAAVEVFACARRRFVHFAQRVGVGPQT